MEVLERGQEKVNCRPQIQEMVKPIRAIGQKRGRYKTSVVKVTAKTVTAGGIQ